MSLQEDIPVFGDWFHIHFTENKGMAFGMDFIGTWALTLFRVVAIGFFVYLLSIIVCKPEKYPVGLAVCLAMIVAGASGNIIDNCIYGLIFSESTPFTLATHVPWGQGYGSFMEGHVVDMFYFPLIETTWPDWVPVVGGDPFVFFNAIFNFADASISCGSVALLIFYHRFLKVK